jgi:hypothetical protein
MTPVQIVLLIVGILAINGLLQGTIWWVILSNLKAMPDKIRRELASTGERIVHGPERGSYDGATGNAFPRVTGLGVLTLTDRRLFFRKLGGKEVTLPLTMIAGVRESATFSRFQGSVRRRGGSQYVILKTQEGAEVAFAIKNASHPAWISALASLTGMRPVAPA